MKFEQLYSFLNHFFNFRLFFNLYFFNKIFNFFIYNYFFQWQVSNYGDSYWFFYSNKKSIHELRYLPK